MRQTANQAASGNGAIALVFHVGRLGRAVPDRERSATLPL